MNTILFVLYMVSSPDPSTSPLKMVVGIYGTQKDCDNSLAWQNKTVPPISPSFYRCDIGSTKMLDPTYLRDHSVEADK